MKTCTPFLILFSEHFNLADLPAPVNRPTFDFTVSAGAPPKDHNISNLFFISRHSNS